MRHMLRHVPTALVILVAAPALAEPATEAGAARIEEALRGYFGQTPGVVAVTAEGESYDAVLDLAPLIALLPVPGLNAETSPIALTLTDLGGGRWDVAREGGMSLGFEAPDAMSMRVTIEDGSWSGVFDEALGGFESSSGTATNLSMSQNMTMPGEPEQLVEYTIDSVRSESAARPGAGGGVDVEMSYSAEGLNEKITMVGAGIPQMEFTITAASYTGDLTGEALRGRELLDLLAWFVARPSVEQIRADEAGMKAAISAALPFFNGIGGTTTISDIRVGTPVGTADIASAEVTVEANGLVTDGRLRERIALTGLQLDMPVIPAWVGPLLPDAVTLDFELADFDAGAAARLALDELTFAGPPAPGMDMRMLAALMPRGSISVTLKPVSLSRSGEGAYSAELEGSMDAGPMGPPVAEASLVIEGLDAVVAALNAAPPEVSQGAVPGIMMARGLARAEGDRLIWDVEATSDGKLLVNGNDLSPLMGR